MSTDHHFLALVEQPIIPTGPHCNLSRKNSLSSNHLVILLWHDNQHHHLLHLSSIHQSTPPESAHLDPMNNEIPGNTTDKNPTMNTIESKATIFAKAIDKIIKSNTTSSKPKLQEPDPLDVSDPKKLRSFILQCN